MLYRRPFPTPPRLTGLALLSLALACTHSMVASDPTPDSAPIALTIDNENFADADIYAVRLGNTMRLGTAPSHQSTTLTIPENALENGDLQLLVHLIGGADFRTEVVHVDTDQQPLLQLQDNLAFSYLSVTHR